MIKEHPQQTREVVPTLGHRLRRSPSVGPTSGLRPVFAVSHNSEKKINKDK